MAPKAKAGEKRKAEEPKKAPAAKEQKAEETKAKEEEKKDDAPEAAPEKVEQEKDAPEDKRPALKEKVGFNTVDTTLNVVPTMGDRLLSVLNDGGLQHFIAGARANVGIKSGRYMFEVKILEVLNPAEAGGGRNRPPMPRQLLRIGFSTAGSPLVLGDSEDHVCFDSEGQFFAGKKRSANSQRFTRDQVVAVLLNLDAKSPNANTISMFCEGVRISEPQPIPEGLHGKTLFPHVSFRNVTIQVLSEAQPAKALPFKCRTLQSAATADVVVSKQKEGKCSVVFPVGLPDQGTFDWLDSFLAKNPDYVELSDRKLTEWAISSGLWKNKANNWNSSNDRPEFNFGLPSVDDRSVQRIVNNIAPIIPRNYVVMEVKGNLTAADRQVNLRRFSASQYDKVAQVVLGEPTAEYKKAQHDMVLKEKQDKLDSVWKTKKIEFERKKQIREAKKKAEEVRQKHQAEMKKKAEEAKAKKEEEAKAKKEAEDAAKKEKEGEEAAKKEKEGENKMEVDESGEKKEEVKKEEKKEEKKEDVKEEEKKEEVKEEEKKEEVKEEEKKEEEPEEEYPAEPEKAELTEEEKQRWFRSKTQRDLTPAVLSSVFGDFTVPEKAEGFDKLVFDWKKEADSKSYLKKWVVDMKRTSRIEDLEPSQWFHEKLKEWQAKLTEFQAKGGKKEPEKKEPEKKEADKEGEKKDGEGDEAPELKANDIFAIENISDMGGGEALFSKFGFEDWALSMLRYEFCLLVRAFAKDVNDPERAGIHEDHLEFYYSKYFRKQLNPKVFGVDSIRELTAFIKDTVEWNDEKVLTTPLGEDDGLDKLIKLTEVKRRERQRRIDVGDETARLHFEKLAMQQGSKAMPAAPGKQKQQPWQQRSSPYGAQGAWKRK